ncbi:MAG: hypothetical protein V3T20_04025 [Gemmatimonadota bacterium]
MLKHVRNTLVALTVMVAAVASFAAAQDAPSAVGDWEGVVAAGPQELTVVFHITQIEDGTYAATLDSPDQGAFGIPCEAPVVEGASINVPVAAVQGGFEGTIAEDGAKIDGTWSQMGNSIPLVLTPVKAEEEAEG